MSYVASESSRDNGSPVELYDITLGTESWHLITGEDKNSTLDGNTYTPLALDRDSLPTAIDDRTANIGIVLPGNHSFVRRFLNVVPTETAFLTIRRFHRTDSDSEVIAAFRGVIASVSFTNNGASASLVVSPITDKLDLPMPRYVYSGLCNNVLGDQWCTIDLAGADPSGLNFTFSDVIVSITSGLTVTMTGITTATYPDNFFQGGRILTSAGDTRLITQQIGNDLSIYVPLFEGTALVGQSVTLYAGCDHSVGTCITRFHNLINYGGFPFVTLINPFVSGVA